MRPFWKPLSSLLIVGGVALAAWPFGQSLYGKWSQRNLASEFQAQQKAPRPQLNRAKPRPASVAKPKITPWPLTKISIPDVDLDAYVVSGWDDASLRRGPGHYERSSLPGEGNCVIAGHRNVYGSPFADLDRLFAGAPITVQNRFGTFTYLVESIGSTTSTDWSIVKPPAPGEKPVLTLVTCTVPHTPNRIIVRALLSATE